MGRRVLGVVTARGGSKGVPRKNLARIGGHTLTGWALNCLVATPEVDRALVSSEDEEIRAHVNRFGPYAPFVRPAELATDEARSLPVLVHALKWAEANDQVTYDFVVLAEPTSPFRLPELFRRGLEVAVRTDASSVSSVEDVGHHHPIRVKRLTPEGFLEPWCEEETEGMRRQEQPPAWIRNGAMYVFPRKTLLANRLWGDRPAGVPVDAQACVNIDTPADLYLARYMWEEAVAMGTTCTLLPDWTLGPDPET